MPKSTLKKKAEKTTSTYTYGYSSWGAPRRPKSLNERVEAVMYKEHGIAADEWVKYVEADKKYERIFKKEVKLFHKEWLQYVEELKKYVKKIKVLEKQSKSLLEASRHYVKKTRD
mgnify:CR=1 FL=1